MKFHSIIYWKARSLLPMWKFMIPLWRMPICGGMGTTVVAVLIAEGWSISPMWGDSRAYLITQEAMEQITRDHSIVQSMVEKGQLTPDEAKNHPRKHFITRALGVEEDVACDYNEFSFPEEGLCSFVPTA